MLKMASKLRRIPRTHATTQAAKGFEEAVHLLPEETISDRRRGSKPIFHPSLGGKMQVRDFR